MRRLNFLQYILHEDKNSLIHSFLKCQIANPTANDWIKTCMDNLDELNIQLTLGDIEIMPKETFRKLVKTNTTRRALEYLHEERSKHSKVSHIQHQDLEIRSYLKTGQVSIQEAKFMFTLRTRMLDIKVNYRGKYKDTICPCCNVGEDTQEHLLTCIALEADTEIAAALPKYEDLFGKDIVKQVEVSRIIKQKYLKRNKLVKVEERNYKLQKEKGNHHWFSGPSDPVFMVCSIHCLY